MSDIVARAAGCPVVHFEPGPVRPAGHYRQKAIEFRDAGAPMWVNTMAQGFWMLTSTDLVREMYMKTDIFTTDSVMAQEPDTDPAFIMTPLNTNPPEHRKYRNLLIKWFSPAAIQKAEPEIRAICRRLVADFAGTSGADIVREFAIRVPTENFLSIVGMPLELSLEFVGYVDAFLKGFSGVEAAEHEDGLTPGMDAAALGIRTRMAEVFADRRANPRNRETDFFTFLVNETIDGRPISDEELQQIALLFINGALDTVRSQLGWMMYHLATFPDDRRRILADPALLPNAIDEMIRYYTIIYGVGRKVSRDLTWHGVELKKGDMVYGLNACVNRDPLRHEDPDIFKLDREVGQTFSFGLGAHNCIGMHFARAQLRIAFEEFHRVIPTYEIASDAVLTERGGEISLSSLPLVWSDVHSN